MNQSTTFLFTALFGCLLATFSCEEIGSAAVVTVRLSTGRSDSDASERENGIEVVSLDDGSVVLRFNGTRWESFGRIFRARLRCQREPIDGTDTRAIERVELLPLIAPYKPGVKPKANARPLPLVPPWYDSFDVTELAREWVAGRGTAELWVKRFPGWQVEHTHLDVMGEGQPGDLPQQVNGLEVVHRAGQSFVVFGEIDERSADANPSWADLKVRLEAMDTERQVRYLVFRHDKPINSQTLPEAELLAEVKPMSGYNVHGRSVDQLIKQHRERARDDLDFAKQLARQDYFRDYHPDMPEMSEVPINRLAVEDGTPLAPGKGIHVHHPQRPGRSYYAVVTSVDGAANMRDFSRANSLDRPVAERPGTGVPILQGTADVTVFFDYPGERLHYVQWTAPPLSHLPDQYYNWGVFVPNGYRKAAVKRLSVFFHDSKQRYLKPPWPHRQDTVLLSPHDAPLRSYGFGYHAALGTLRSFNEGRVQPFLARRVDAMLAWAMDEFGPDPARVSSGGHGPWGGTAALQYALHRPGRIAYVMADGAPDPDPQQTPHEYKHYGRENEQPRTTHRRHMEAVWGKGQWNIPAESGKTIWEEVNLTALVRADPNTTMPYLSLGAGSMHVTWKQETDLMKAYLDTGNPLMSAFFWGSREVLPLPVDPIRGDYPFEPRLDKPLLACKPLEHGPNPKFFEPDGPFATGRRGYGSGGRLCTRPRWHPDDIVDTEDRLEMTVYSARTVSYAGSVRCDVTVRNTQKFSPQPGEKIVWKVTPADGGPETQSGQVTVGRDRRVTVPGVAFGRPARLVVERDSD